MASVGAWVGIERDVEVARRCGGARGSRRGGTAPPAGCAGSANVDARMAAASSTTPAEVTHDRSWLIERKNTSDGCEVWVSSMSANQTSQSSHISSRASSRLSAWCRRIISHRRRRLPGTGRQPGDEELAPLERRVDRRQVADQEGDEAEPEHRLDERGEVGGQVARRDEAEGEQRRARLVEGLRGAGRRRGPRTRR